jgi:actin-related protein
MEADVVNPVVIDNGSGICKAGYAGESMQYFQSKATFHFKERRGCERERFTGNMAP